MFHFLVVWINSILAFHKFVMSPAVLAFLAHAWAGFLALVFVVTEILENDAATVQSALDIAHFMFRVLELILFIALGVLGVSYCQCSVPDHVAVVIPISAKTQLRIHVTCSAVGSLVAFLPRTLNIFVYIHWFWLGSSIILSCLVERVLAENNYVLPIMAPRPAVVPPATELSVSTSHSVVYVVARDPQLYPATTPTPPNTARKEPSALALNTVSGTSYVSSTTTALVYSPRVYPVI
jgi:hypothetical protein